MPIIQAQGLTKTYRVFQKQPGLWGSVRGYAALLAAETTQGDLWLILDRSRIPNAFWL